LAQDDVTATGRSFPNYFSLQNGGGFNSRSSSKRQRAASTTQW
jgi:hypothetical protein